MQTILVVEDEPPIVQVLTAVLEEEGYLVATASNGHEALAYLADARPDLILSDMMMPRMGGAELCKQLHADPKYRAIPLVLMSSTYRLVQLDGCVYAAFVQKPFGVDELLATVRQVLGAGSDQQRADNAPSPPRRPGA